MNWIPELTVSQHANLQQLDERSGDPAPELIESGFAEVEVDPGLYYLAPKSANKKENI
jgi:hypothetical protein